MNENILQLIAALGSLATFGAFIFLFIKDKNKQKQINALNEIVLHFKEKEKRQLKPDIQKISSGTHGAEGTLKIQLSNNAETAMIDKINYISDDINFRKVQKNFPFKLNKGKNLILTGITKGTKHIGACKYQISIYYSDIVGNSYISILTGIGEKLKISETERFE